MSRKWRKSHAWRTVSWTMHYRCRLFLERNSTMWKRLGLLLAILPISSLAQLAPQKKDPLSKLPPPQGAAACSATKLSACAAAAAKISPHGLGDEPMGENLPLL